eukprot:scaffold226436_cov22-Tisochrysis_lutea.AAC.1
MAGFGAPKPAPKTLEEVVREFGNRLPKKPGEADCACGSGETYAACCRPYHTGDKMTETPEEALRARWTAFAYRLPIYIINSTDKTNGDFMKDQVKWAKKLSKTSMFDNFDFSASKLGIGEVEPGESDKEVYMENSFTLQPKAPMGAAPVVTYERTKFIRRKAGWMFASGAVSSEAPGLKNRGPMKSEADVAKLQKDVDYAKKLVGEKLDVK